jgi:NAD+ synthase
MINQTSILAEMRVLPNIDSQFEITRRVAFIKQCLLSAGLKTLVLGISGGVDSSTCGRLAQLAVNELNNDDSNQDYRFIAVRLPYAEQADEDDAQAAIQFIQPSQTLVVNIQSGVDAIHASVTGAIGDIGLLPKSEGIIDFNKGNVKARMRMVAQYEIAGILGGLVIGTDHSAENITVYKAPTADLESLAPSKPDEDALGLSYDQIDDFLEGKSVGLEAEQHLIEIYLRTQHKRQSIGTIYDA